MMGAGVALLYQRCILMCFDLCILLIFSISIVVVIIIASNRDEVCGCGCVFKTTHRLWPPNFCSYFLGNYMHAHDIQYALNFTA